MLNDATLKTTLEANLLKVLTNRNSATDEDQSPEDAIKDVAKEMASAISDAVSAYVRSATVTIGPANISVTSSTGSCVVAPMAPANLQ